MPLVNPRESAPAFSLRDQRGKRHALAGYAGRVVVLYFYPKDDTSGCTDQACQFRDALPEFADVDAVVLGVSPDSEESHQRFVDKNELNFPLLADLPDADGNPPVCELYGVWAEKSMYGRTYMGVNRTTYLIGRDGVVARRWDAVMVPGHAKEVLDAVTALNSAKEPVSIEVKPRKTGKAGAAGGTAKSVKKKAAASVSSKATGVSSKATSVSSKATSVSSKATSVSSKTKAKAAAPVRKSGKSVGAAAVKKTAKKAAKKRTLVGAGARVGVAKASKAAVKTATGTRKTARKTGR